MILALFCILMLPLLFFAGYRAGVAHNRALVNDAVRECNTLRARQNARAQACGYRFDAQNNLIAIGQTSMRLSDV